MNASSRFAWRAAILETIVLALGLGMVWLLAVVLWASAP